jgi:arylformamidase
MLIDLTVELAHEMIRHPAPHLPGVEIVPVTNHEQHKRSVQRVTFGTHVSTHIDAPLHAIPNGRTIEFIPLDTLVGEAAIIRIANVDKSRPIDRSDLEAHSATLSKYRRIIIDTGWLKATWGTLAYFTEGPYLTREAARYFGSFRHLLVGMDFPNIDSTEETKSGLAAPNHNIILGAGTVLLENLQHLSQIPDSTFELIALPLRLIGGDGCPCRAVARISEQ